MDELAATQPTLPEVLECLARQLSRAYLRMATFYRERMKLSADQADAAARSLDDHRWARRALEAPADQVSWFDLSTLAEHDPEAALAAWRRIEAEARVELASGHRAARALAWDDTPWQRARFLAIRESFRAEWRPRGGIEDALIDQMAQAQSSYLFWMERLHI